MAELIPFNPDIAPRNRKRTLEKSRRETAPPPEDALDRASWLHNILCVQLHEAMTDRSLTAEEKRTITLAFGARITQAMPNHEVASARDVIRASESDDDIASSTLGGEVTRVEKSGSRSLRAATPRGKS